MVELSPKQASSLARDVYALTDLDTIEEAVDSFQIRYGKSLDIGPNRVVKGKTGGPGFIKSRTGFGFTLVGKDRLKGHAFIVLRGTRYLADWLTNLNVGTSKSFKNQAVHDGFNKAFKTMLPKIEPFLKGLKKQGIKNVHCIGHSLGGALATICAEYVKHQFDISPYLYTFGSPRVGFYSFASKLTSEIGAERIFRVYHRTDIVPCIPFWPFVHAPEQPGANISYFLPSPGAFPGAEWHDMKFYVRSVKNHNWNVLSSIKNHNKTSDSIEKWLSIDGPVAFNVTNLEWLDSAINYVVTKCFKFVGESITMAFSSAFTLMDRLAYILKKGIDISGELSSLVVYLLQKIMRFLGLGKVVDKANVTRQLILNVFTLLSHKVSNYCQRVLDGVLVQGRGA